MTRQRLSIVLLALVLVAVSAPASATVFELWKVTLNSGESFESRYEPVETTWDEDVITFMTSVGNWIAVPKSDVASIGSALSEKGYGVRIDKNTIQLGFVANDGDAEGGKRGFYAPGDVDGLRSYDVQQFVDPSEAGGGGLPLGFAYGGGGQGAQGGGSFGAGAPVGGGGGGGGGGGTAPVEPPVQ